ncbi:flagellin [Bacillus alveayuensis]|jgi:flagellin|uniref:flagellin N-terminal helical domain-containing protein n=1 Tax=Aeribacillus alveayuensis TaxID=279215 RepID=UPI0005D10C32|nr:flagellin [Bacillus alveayuensis]
MRINHNIPALNAYHHLNRSTMGTSKVIEKLSSGLRINRAADDAAGLAISEKMKSQIRGLEQADRNILDGISLVQTAEGGLSSIHDMLQRMRELSVQAANDTLTPEDRQAIQREIEQIKQGINDIANYTDFNNIKVLTKKVVEKSGTVSKTGKADIVFIVDISGSMGGIIDEVISNLDTFTDKLASNGIDFNLGLVSYSDTTIGEPLEKWDFTNNVDIFNSNMSTMRSNLLVGGDMNESGLEGIMDSDKGALSFDFRDDASKQFILITDAPVHDDNDGDDGDGLSSYDIDSVASHLTSQGIKLTVVGPTSGEAYTQLQRLSTPTGGDYLNVYGDFGSELSTYADSVIADSGNIEDEMSHVILQIGANSGNTFTVELTDARTTALGIDDIKVDPREEAQKAINKIDDAIEKVSSERAKFGAYQNALEHIYNNVRNSNVNLTAAESRIADADMALEMAEFTKRNILNQSAQAMLSQANQFPQGILQLLKQ